MTGLHKTVKRVTAARVFSKGKYRPVVVELMPPDLVSFRLKGERRTYPLPADWCFRKAVMAWTANQKRERAEARKLARANRV